MVTQVDYGRLASEIVSSVRGREKQGDLSTRLGFTFNQLHKWEAGSTAIKWREFAALCAATGRDLKGALAVLGYRGDADAPLALVEHLTLGAPPARIAADYGVDARLVSRWLRAIQEPKVAEILRLIDGFRGVLPTFLGALLPNTALRQLPANLHYDREVAAAYADPLVSYVPYCFGLEEYKNLKTHREGFVAARLGISLAEERRCIKALVASGTLVQDGAKFVVTRDQHVDFAGDLKGFDRLAAFWFERAIARLKARGPDDQGLVAGFNVFVASRAGLAAIERCTRAYVLEVEKIIEADAGAKTSVATIGVFTMDNTSRPRASEHREVEQQVR
jgi:transcriptional regulator with XRE-family HTH domain